MGTIRHVMSVRAPVSRAYRAWSDLPFIASHFPQLFTSAERLEDGVFKVVFSNLVGRTRELRIELTEAIEDQVLAFRVFEGGLQITGSVGFEASGADTYMTMVFCYDPPGVRLGDVLSELLKYPHTRIREGLVSLVAAIERDDLPAKDD